MVTAKSVEEQLKRIGFYTRSFNRAETLELASILLDDETIFECVNGWYEGGFSLLVATNLRILLIDKKPFKFLTVEDLRFDMINQIDYSHRMLDARITVSTGNKSLKFRSFNQARLRKLIGHVQHRMAEMKLEQSSHTQKQQEHLKQIDEQLQTYLLAQYQQNESFRNQLNSTPAPTSSFSTDYSVAEPLTISPEDTNWLTNLTNLRHKPATPNDTEQKESYIRNNGVTSDELYKDGMREVAQAASRQNAIESTPQIPSINNSLASVDQPSDYNPLKIAYSKLPILIRNRQFGRASLQQSSVTPPSYDFARP